MKFINSILNVTPLIGIIMLKRNKINVIANNTRCDLGIAIPIPLTLL